MSEKLHYQLVGEPELLEVVDDDWLTATLPDDGASPMQTGCCPVVAGPSQLRLTCCRRSSA